MMRKTPLHNAAAASAHSGHLSVPADTLLWALSVFAACGFSFYLLHFDHGRPPGEFKVMLAAGVVAVGIRLGVGWLLGERRKSRRSGSTLEVESGVSSLPNRGNRQDLPELPGDPGDQSPRSPTAAWPGMRDASKVRGA